MLYAVLICFSQIFDGYIPSEVTEVIGLQSIIQTIGHQRLCVAVDDVLRKFQTKKQRIYQRRLNMTRI